MLERREAVVLHVICLDTQQAASLSRMRRQDPVVARTSASLRDQVQRIRVDYQFFD